MSAVEYGFYAAGKKRKNVDRRPGITVIPMYLSKLINVLDSNLDKKNKVCYSWLVVTNYCIEKTECIDRRR